MKKQIVIVAIILCAIFMTPFIANKVTTATKDKAIDGHTSLSITTSSSMSESTSTSESSSTETVISTSTSTNTNTNTSTNTSISTSTIQESTSVSVTPPAKTAREKSNDVIASIKATYGFDVKYGDGTYCYYGGGSCTPLYDDDKAYTYLVELQRFLGNFPTSFFRAFQGYNGYHIELMEDIPGNTAGYVSYEMPGDNAMYLDINTSFQSRVFYHETWHLIEELMLYRNNFNDVFTD